MISIEKLIPILASYKSRFLSIWKDEKYQGRYERPADQIPSDHADRYNTEIRRTNLNY